VKKDKMPELAFYSIEWQYKGPYCNIPTDDERTKGATDGNWIADREARTVMTLASVEFEHQYSWPDGSLYYYISAYEDFDVKKALDEAMARVTREKLAGFALTRVLPTDECNKFGCRTVKEHFDLNRMSMFLTQTIAEPEFGGTLMEEMASLEHDRWAGWMKYLFTKGSYSAPVSQFNAAFDAVVPVGDGALQFTIDAGSVQHWTRQMNTKYASLTEKEKESDRVEVRKTIDLLRKFLKSGT
jgi:hypothetical protein